MYGMGEFLEKCWSHVLRCTKKFIYEKRPFGSKVKCYYSFHRDEPPHPTILMPCLMDSINDTEKRILNRFMR